MKKTMFSATAVAAIVIGAPATAADGVQQPAAKCTGSATTGLASYSGDPTPPQQPAGMTGEIGQRVIGERQASDVTATFTAIEIFLGFPEFPIRIRVSGNIRFTDKWEIGGNNYFGRYFIESTCQLDVREPFPTWMDQYEASIHLKCTW